MLYTQIDTNCLPQQLHLIVKGHTEDNYGTIVTCYSGTTIKLRFWKAKKTQMESILPVNNYVVFNLTSEQYKNYLKYKSIPVDTFETFNKTEGLIEFPEIAEKLDRDNLIAKAENLFESIKPELSDNVLSMWDTIKNIPAFMTSPASAKFHHDYEKGLYHHTLEVMYNTFILCKNRQDINLDVAMLGAMLHDIGKIYCYDFDNDKNITQAATGQLLGHHIPIGMSLATEFMKPWNYSPDIIKAVLHIIASHHGNKEWGALASPSSTEAYIVFMADYLSSNLGVII